MSYPFDIDVSKVKFKKKTMPLIEFITDYYPITNCNPIGQRPPVYLAIGIQSLLRFVNLFCWVLISDRLLWFV